MELRKNCRKLTTALSRFWHREAGPMNWKNPIRVLAVVGWSVFQGVVLLAFAATRVLRFLAGLPGPVILFFAGLCYAVWHFVRRPFPALDENPLLDLMNYHTPNFYGWVMLWYYLFPAALILMVGLILLAISRVWFGARHRSLSPLGELPQWLLDPRGKGSVIVKS